MRHGLNDLARLSAMVRDRDLAAVERIVAQLGQIAADIGRIEAARAERARDGAFDTARMTGMDMRWQAECERAVRILRRREAALRAQHEVALTQARQSFGRADVTRRLAAVKPPV